MWHTSKGREDRGEGREGERREVLIMGEGRKRGPPSVHQLQICHYTMHWTLLSQMDDTAYRPSPKITNTACFVIS